MTRNYELRARQIKLSNQLKPDLFINFFTGAARVFFYNHCRDDMSFEKLADVVLREYGSDAHRLGVQSELKILTIEQIMVDSDITDDAVRLTKFVEHIILSHCDVHPNSALRQIRLDSYVMLF